MMLNLTRARGLLLLSAAFPWLAHSQDVLPSSVLADVKGPGLEATVVTATRIATRADELTSELVVVEREAIERSAGRTLAEVLARTASLQMASSGGRGKQSSVMVRGTEARHTILLIDGVRYGSVTAGAPVWDGIPLEMVERIEVLKGPASALYGADAAGGVVQVFTRRGSPGLHPFASATLGSAGFRELSAGLRGGQGELRYTLGVNDVHDDGFSATNAGAAFGIHNPDRDGFRQQALNASLDWQLATDWSFSAGALHSDGTNHFDEGPGADSQSAVRSQVLRLGLQGRLQPGWDSRLNYSQSSDRDNALVSVNAQRLPRLYETQQNQWTWQNDVQTPVGTVVLGLESLQQKVVSSTAYVRTERRINSGFVGVSGAGAGHSWQLNLRHDDNSQFGRSRTGYAGYGYQLSRQWRAHASYGTAFVAPSFNLLYWPDFSNPLLQPEKGKNAELGLDWTQGAHQVKLLHFDNRIRGFITSGRAPVNLPRVRIQGWTLGYDGQFDAFKLRVAHDQMRPRNVLSGQQLPRRAKSQTTLGADYQAGAWGLGGTLLHMGRRYDDAANLKPLAAYTTLDLYLDYRVSPKWTLQAKLNNAGGQVYETAQGYNQPGRQVFATLRYQP